MLPYSFLTKFSHQVFHLVLDSGPGIQGPVICWSLELNSQMASVLSQIGVLSILWMSSFPLEASEEYTGNENLYVFTNIDIEGLLDDSRFRSDFA